ncbi:MAG TPA: ABC transporter ATP-binding protein [Bosea sp. (in: a-proteobacteria)]|jgi:ABC-type branched-subunit amino acid transport system ATPase component|uniref:ABC transporter ATP-binding protein n=1 Tax=Bosea sp. (in: a-proteobacteria) TaxID=1871050 RepID=UPI002E13119E|nr:ABC transporter ATP-binding protein [Bosea sp. (in: a-proteobacteria)]
MTAQSILSVQGVSRSFRGLKAVNEVSFEVPRGSICSLIGPNGAGKSTFFNLVTGYFAPDTGTITFEGRDITGFSPVQVAHLGVARAFQIAKPFPGMSVTENVRIGALFGRTGPRDVAAVTAQAMELAGLAELHDREARELTVGQLRRLEVARALAARPSLLLADEPCAGLNPTETAEMVTILRRIRDAGATIVLVEHDMPAVMEVSDTVLVLEAGCLIAQGKPEEIARDPRVIAAYLGTDE